MRVKTSARREAILETATALFREVGYERASMAEISARAGGSKATLYNYFRSKEELFATSMLEALEEQGQSVIDLLDASDKDAASVLRRFGEAYLKLITSDDALAMIRTAIAEGANSDLGAKLYDRGPRRAWADVSSYISNLQKRGQLRSGPADVIAMQFKGLLESDFYEPLLWGAEVRQDTATAAMTAVDTLLSAYGRENAVL